MAKRMALDVGDSWVGVAISDEMGLLARPYATLKREDLVQSIEGYLIKEPISHMVVGLPRTMKGTDSDQTRSTREVFAELKDRFPGVVWLLWDERLTSQWASGLGHKKRTMASIKEEKQKEHARAAAFILQGYLSSIPRD